MSSFAQGFGFGFLNSTLFGGFGFGGFGFGGFGFGRTIDPIFTCHADLNSRSGMSSFLPGLNYTLNQGYTFPLSSSSNLGMFSLWC